MTPFERGDKVALKKEGGNPKIERSEKLDRSLFRRNIRRSQQAIYNNDNKVNRREFYCKDCGKKIYIESRDCFDCYLERKKGEK